MFFILSKILSYLVMPIPVITVLLVLAAAVRRQRLKRIFFSIALALLIVFSNDYLANEVMRAWEIPVTPFAELQPHKLGIVLTGATSSREPNDRVYFNKGADRVVHTVQLYKQGLIETILISGGTGRLVNENEPEADKFRKAMILMGVDSTDILIENVTRNTYESALAVKPMLDTLGYTANDCLLITSAFHMRRSLACYHKAGVNLQPFSTDFYTHNREFYFNRLIVPSIDAIIVWQKLLHEWTGMAAYRIAGYI